MNLVFFLSYAACSYWIVFKKIKAKLDRAAIVTVISYLLTILLRLIIWILVITEIQDETGSKVLELMVSFTGIIIYSSLYFFTFEMQAT